MPAPQPESIVRLIRMLPAILGLLETSPLHFLHPVEVLFDRIFPSLLNGQHHLLMRDGRPVAFVNWAWLSPPVAERFASCQYHLRPEEWHCGPELWFCEIVAREGAMPVLIHELLARFPGGTRARWTRIGPSGDPHGIGEVRMPGGLP